MTADPRPSGGAVRTIFLGSGEFAAPILDAVAAAPGIELVGVVTAPDRPVGRRGELTPVPVARRARDLALPLLQPERLRAPAAISAVTALQPGFGVLADYGQIVPAAILELLGHGILNVHPSALPRHRGASPIPATVLAGDRDAAVSLIRMDEGLDTGPIVAQERWPLDGSETSQTLEAEAARRGAALVARTIGPWLRGELAAVPQATDGVTLTRPLRREDGRLDLRRDAAALERQVRAHLPWPGSFVETGLGRLIVHEAAVAAREPGERPGRIVVHDDGLALTTGDGRLVLRRAQLAGRRVTDAAALRRGAPGLVGQAVELR